MTCPINALELSLSLKRTHGIDRLVAGDKVIDTSRGSCDGHASGGVKRHPASISPTVAH